MIFLSSGCWIVVKIWWMVLGEVGLGWWELKFEKNNMLIFQGEGLVWDLYDLWLQGFCNCLLHERVIFECFWLINACFFDSSQLFCGFVGFSSRIISVCHVFYILQDTRAIFEIYVDLELDLMALKLKTCIWLRLTLPALYVFLRILSWLLNSFRSSSTGKVSLLSMFFYSFFFFSTQFSSY